MYIKKMEKKDILTQVFEYAETILFSVSNTYWLKWLAGSFLLLFMPFKLFIYIILFFAGLDLVLGVAASIRKGEGFSSRKFSKGTLAKFLLYTILAGCAAVVDATIKYMFPLEKFYAVWLITSLISAYEISSIMESVKILWSNNALVRKIDSLWQWFKKMVEVKTKEKIENKIDKL